MSKKYITEVTFYHFKFQICYTICNNITNFICYRILSRADGLFGHSFGLDINNPSINNYLREKYSNLNQNNDFIYDNYLKSLIDRSINQYYISTNSIAYIINNNSYIYNLNNVNNEYENINNEIVYAYNIYQEINIINENQIENSLFHEFQLNADNFLEELSLYYSIPLIFQNHLKDVIYRTIWTFYETIINIPDSYWNNNNIERLTETEFNIKIKHEEMSNKLLENLNSIDKTCSICLDKIEFNDKTTILQCNHIYHYNCAKIWFTSKCYKLTCPYCRCDIIKSK